MPLLVAVASGAVAQEPVQNVGKPLELDRFELELVYGDDFSVDGRVDFERNFIEEGKRIGTPAADADWIAEGQGGAMVCGGKLWVAPVVFTACGETVGERENPSHMVVWNRNRFPSDLLFEFTVNHQGSDDGLTLVFFSAEGLRGETIFDDALPPREGIYRNYNRGQLRNYTVSYWSRNKKPSLVKRGEQYTNRMRKNPGAIKLSTEYSRTDQCSDCDYRVRVLKSGGLLAVEIDGEVVNQVIDPDPLGSGFIGLRNMMGVDRVSYDDFRVWELK